MFYRIFINVLSIIWNNRVFNYIWSKQKIAQSNPAVCCLYLPPQVYPTPSVLTTHTTHAVVGPVGGQKLSIRYDYSWVAFYAKLKNIHQLSLLYNLQQNS